MRWLGATLIAVVLCGTVSQACAEKRAALVIGNSSYRNVPSLANPLNDASEIAALFKSAGFSTVSVRRDIGISDMRRAISDFAEVANDVDVAVVYFAGHGIEVDGSNYVIPVDAKLSRDFDIEDETVSVDRILKSIEPARRLRLVILDACRDNPFLKTMKRTVATRSVGRGLAKVEPAVSDTLIAFAAKAGSTAADGDGKNSPFTRALLNNIAAPGLDLRIAFGRVRDEVLKSTDRKQEPFVYGSLGGSIISIVDPPNIAPPPSTDEIVWNAIKDSAYPAVFEEFLTKFPASQRLREAQSRRDELKAQLAAAAARIPAPPTADQIVWAAIKSSDYPAIFDDFLNKFPASSHASDARSRRDQLKQQLAATQLPPPPPADQIVWMAIKGSQDPAIFEEFASKYPESPRRREADARRDELQKLRAKAAKVPPPQAADAIVWNAIKDSKYSAIFEEFIGKFPESAHLGDAKSRLDELGKNDALNQKKMAALGVPTHLQPAPERDPSASGAIDVGLKVLENAAESALKPKATFRECSKCPEMVVVPAGHFLMGSPEKEPHREAVEGPQHKVAIARPFAAGRFAVTFEEWETCVADGGCNGYRPWDNGWGRAKRPVISVSWQDAKNYVAWLSQRTGKPYRLLSEAEREYVARAGTTSPFWWGGSASRSNANYDDRPAKEKASNASSRQKTMPVDSFQPNPWGFYQVNGNVWEWVEDCMNDNYAGAPADGSARITGNCERRVLRGGSWVSEASMVRSAGRYGVQADGRVGNVGFRVARTLKE